MIENNKAIQLTFKTDEGKDIKLWMDLEEYEFQQLFYKFREQTLSLTGFNSNKDLIEKAEEYLINKYPEYTIFKK